MTSYFVEHFNTKLKRKQDGMKLTRENYINRRVLTDKNWGEAFLKVKHDLTKEQVFDEQEERALMNFDLNMSYFLTLDTKNFNQEIIKFTTLHNFKETKDLSNCKEVSGYYLMILDEYCQMYLGTATNIRQRIMSHWSATKGFDRLIFGSPENSIISIDSFRALDTTRIFLLEEEPFQYENLFLDQLQSQYMLNRTSGGILDGGLLGAIINRKARNFTQ